MHSLTRIRAAAYSIMLASAGALSVPLTAYAQGDAAAGANFIAKNAAGTTVNRWISTGMLAASASSTETAYLTAS